MSELTVGTISGLAANDYVVDVAAGSLLTQPGMVLQVVSITKIDAFSTTSTSYTDITGLSVSITPKSASSKILIIGNVSASQESLSSTIPMVKLSGGNTNNYTSTFGTSRNGAAAASGNSAWATPGYGMGSLILNYLDSPSTTEEVTYSAQISTTAGTVFVNRYGANDGTGATSTLTVMEIAQ